MALYSELPKISAAAFDFVIGVSLDEQENKLAAKSTAVATFLSPRIILILI
jgi:hypothetical protein